MSTAHVNHSDIVRFADERVNLKREDAGELRRQVNGIVAGIEKMLIRLIGEDISFATVLDECAGRVRADAGQIEQVIMNLVVNARDAMPQGGHLTIETRNVALDETAARQHAAVRPGRYVMLTVTDTGHGIDAKTRAHIFEPFFTTKEVGKGTGLGLSTVYGIVTQSEGTIELDSEPGRGAAFKVYLPEVKEELEGTEAASTPARSSHGSETILLVEDEDLVRGATRAMLVMSGYTVLEANSGAEAVRVCKVHKGPIDLVMTDVVMPGMNGRQTAEHLARLRPDVKVLFTSGYADDAIVRHGVLDPGTQFIQKPYTADSLPRKIREVLDAEAVPGRQR